MEVSLVNTVLLPVFCQAEGPVVTAQYDCLGCLHPISTSSPELQPVLRHTIQHFNNKSDHLHLFHLHEIKSAQRQVCSLTFHFFFFWLFVFLGSHPRHMEVPRLEV